MDYSTLINNQRMAEIAGVDFNTEHVRGGPIVYSRTHTVHREWSAIGRLGPVRLVTSFSDACVTDELAAKLPRNVELWFSNNVMTYNPRVIPIPIGIRHSHDVEANLRHAMDAGRMQQRNLAYLCCLRNIPRDPNPREGIYEQFSGLQWVTAEGGFEHVPVDQFYAGLRSHAFTISPPGAGPDCHRHWEAMLLGCIPIVIKSRATDILSDMPCLRVENWGQVTEDLLLRERKALAIRFKWPSMRKCFMEYWAPRIRGDRILLSCGIPRSGSTLTWQILRKMFPGDEVVKTHPDAWEPSGAWVVATIRDPLDVAASRFRLRLVRCRDDSARATEYISGWTGIQAELHQMRNHFAALGLAREYPRLILLRYEDFIDNYDVIYDAICDRIGTTLSAVDRHRIADECGIEANSRRASSADIASADFREYQIHPGHIGAVRPGSWRGVIPQEYHDRVVEFCRPIRKEWGYE